MSRNLFVYNNKGSFMQKFIQFGENIDGYSIPVLNEREIRASAGILFIVLFFAIMYVLFEQDFQLFKIFCFSFSN